MEEVVEFLRGKGYTQVREVEVMPENVRFGLPPEIVEAIGSAPAATVANVKDAVAGYLESLKKHAEPVPPSIDEEVVEVLP